MIETPLQAHKRIVPVDKNRDYTWIVNVLAEMVNDGKLTFSKYVRASVHLTCGPYNREGIDNKQVKGK